MHDKRPVVVGIDVGEHARVALQHAIEEADARDADLHVVHVLDFTPAVLHLAGGVIDTAQVADSHRGVVWAAVEEMIERAPVTVVRKDLDGYPADVLVDYCDEVDAGLLVLGTRGRGRLSSTFLGSTSLRALERARCNVFIAKPAAVRSPDIG